MSWLGLVLTVLPIVGMTVPPLLVAVAVSSVLHALGLLQGTRLRFRPLTLVILSIAAPLVVVSSLLGLLGAYAVNCAVASGPC